TLDRAPRLSTHTSGYDIVVFDGVTEQPVDARGVLTFGAAGAPSPVTVQRRESKPQFVSAEPSPLMEGVDLRNVYIEASQRVAPKATSEAIAHGDKGPLVVADRSGRTTRIYVAFEPLRSDFPLQIGFPIFIANCLGFLGGREMGSSLRVSAGQAFSLSLEGPATLEHPDGRTETLTSVAGNVVVRSARAVGRYQLTTGSQTKTLFATLRSDRESDIMPNPEVALGGGQVRSQEAPVRFTDFWRPLVLLALLVLAGEWWLYARRS
ncbi:MAG TPA: hypothetical protein VM328_07050, partial [Fimbriimonadaceae bacterium]|nr:hypothetical protein [Fimbriimonadaceae bacterium]